MSQPSGASAASSPPEGGRFASQVEAMFAGRVRFDPSLVTRPPEKLVLLCFSNRSGSNYLAAALGSTPSIRNFGEALLPDGLARLRQAQPEASLHAILAKRIGDLGSKRIACVKVGFNQLHALQAWGYLDGYRPRLHFVHIRREDVLGQAISFVIASTTKAWASFQRPATQDVAYDHALIERQCESIERVNRKFDVFFAEHGIAPSRVVYEPLVADPGGNIASIGQAIGETDLVFKPERVSTEQQIDPRKDEFRRRFLAETDGSAAT